MTFSEEFVEEFANKFSMAYPKECFWKNFYTIFLRISIETLGEILKGIYSDTQQKGLTEKHLLKTSREIST